MKKPQILLTELGFHHGELFQAPRDLFEALKTCKPVFGNVCVPRHNRNQLVASTFSWLFRPPLDADGQWLGANKALSHREQARGRVFLRT